MGVICDYKCETLTLVTSSGYVLDKFEYSALCSLIVMKTFEKANIYVPLSSPDSIEIMAKKYLATVKRGKISAPNLMNELSRTEEDSFRAQFIYRFDAVGAIILLLDYLCTKNETLSSLLYEIPPSNTVESSVSCNVREQEKIIKRFSEKYNTRQKDGADAFKISFENGWVLIVPQKAESAIEVISHASSLEYAREIADICTDEIARGRAKKD